MKKRGQISLIMIAVVAVLIIVGLIVYAYSASSKSKTSASAIENMEAGNADIVKSYAENCIKMAAERALFERIGLQGGYINTEPEPEYGEPGIVNSLISPPKTEFLEKRVPYYLEAVCLEYDKVIGCTPGTCSPAPRCIRTSCSQPIGTGCTCSLNADITE